METKQIILETRTDEDVIEITLAMIDLQVPVLHEPRRVIHRKIII